jgi:hypothetical protein
MRNRKIAALVGLVLVPLIVWAANTTITALTAGSALTGTEVLPMDQGAGTVKTTPAAIDTYVKTLGATLGVSKGGTGATTLTGVLHGNGTSAVTAANVDLTSEVTGTLPLANGGGLTTATDDSVAVGNGTVLQSKALTSCSGASNAVTYNTSTNAFGCNTISGGTSQSTGNFTASFTDACSTTPTQVINYVLTGSSVTLRITQNIGACTSDSTSFSTAAGDLPVSLRPAAAVTFQGFLCQDQGSNISCGLRLATDGTISYCVSGTGVNTCAATNWTGSANKAQTVTNAQSTVTYALN